MMLVGSEVSGSELGREDYSLIPRNRDLERGEPLRYQNLVGENKSQITNRFT